MKTKTEVIINADRETVWRLFDSQENLRRWQPTLVSVTHRSGTPRQPGATSELAYAEGDREVRLTQTVAERREPDLLAAVYESKMGKALIVNHFEAVDDNTTRWLAFANHSFSGMMRLGSLFIAKSIRQRAEADMNRFKLLVETDLAESRQ